MWSTLTPVRRRGLLSVGVAALVLAVCGAGGAREVTSPLSGTASTPAAVASSAPTPLPSPAATPTPTPTPEPVPREFTIVATGDVLLHERLWVQAQRDADPTGDWDFAPQLAGIKPVVAAADLAICHLETPLAPRDGPYEGYPVFSSPPQIVPALVEIGYSACTTASNHTFDRGGAGVDRTLDYLDEAGLAHAGSARTEAEAAEPTLIEVETGAGPVTVGLLSHTYGFNGIPYPDGETWRANVIDENAVLAGAAAVRAAGAQFVVLALHWGDEYQHDPNPQQLELAPRLIKSPDIDLILGHHAHVVQPLENFDGEWVVYGMGNLMAAHRTPGEPQNEGLLVRFTVTENAETGRFTTTAAEYLPLLQTDAMPVSVVNVSAALEGGDPGTATAARIDKAMDRTTEVVGRRDAFEHGLRLIED